MLDKVEPHASKRSVMFKVICGKPELNRWFEFSAHATRYKEFISKQRGVGKIKIKLAAVYLPQNRRQMVNLLNKLAPPK